MTETLKDNINFNDLFLTACHIIMSKNFERKYLQMIKDTLCIIQIIDFLGILTHALLMYEYIDFPSRDFNPCMTHVLIHYSPSDCQKNAELAEPRWRESRHTTHAQTTHTQAVEMDVTCDSVLILQYQYLPCLITP